MSKNNEEEYTSMIRLQFKATLIEDCTQLFCVLAKSQGCTPKRFRDIATRTILKDFKKGLKQINKKIPVFVEVPEYSECSPKSYSKTTAEESEIVVPDVVNTSSLARKSMEQS